MGELKITVERLWPKPEYTIGRLYLDGALLCNTCEDPDRGLRQDMPLAEIKAKKVYGNTAIPKGTYEVTMSYSQKFKRQLPLLHDVPGYSGVRIHAGNSTADTEGCILPGENTQKGKVLNSKKYETLINNAIDIALALGRKVYIEIK